MKITKPLIIGGAATTLALAGIVGAASAQSTPGTTLVDKIATRFHLNKSDVQQVFDQNRTDMQASRETAYETRLTQAVTDGKLTSAQKDLILAKHKVLMATMEANRTKAQSETPEQRRTDMDAQRTAIQQWEKDNNIPSGYLGLGGPGMGGHHGMRDGMGMGDDNAPETPAQ